MVTRAELPTQISEEPQKPYIYGLFDPPSVLSLSRPLQSTPRNYPQLSKNAPQPHGTVQKIIESSPTPLLSGFFVLWGHSSSEVDPSSHLDDGSIRGTIQGPAAALESRPSAKQLGRGSMRARVRRWQQTGPRLDGAAISPHRRTQEPPRHTQASRHPRTRRSAGRSPWRRPVCLRPQRAGDACGSGCPPASLRGSATC